MAELGRIIQDKGFPTFLLFQVAACQVAHGAVFSVKLSWLG